MDRAYSDDARCDCQTNKLRKLSAHLLLDRHPPNVIGCGIGGVLLPGLLIHGLVTSANQACAAPQQSFSDLRARRLSSFFLGHALPYFSNARE